MGSYSCFLFPISYFLFCHQLLFFVSAALFVHAMSRGLLLGHILPHDRLNMNNETLRHLAIMYVNKMDKKRKCEEE